MPAPLKNCAVCVLAESRRVVVDDVPEDQRIEQREDLVGRRQHERQKNQPAILAQVGEEEIHTGY